ncbi:SpvB/TcaC N-terminal domain-containing protein [Flavobacterium sp. SUN046]|nr:SpvB/TcaC N-terminal domain-containing protein [Flavobacterium sp. SUN046]
MIAILFYTFASPCQSMIQDVYGAKKIDFNNYTSCNTGLSDDKSNPLPLQTSQNSNQGLQKRNEKLNYILTKNDIDNYTIDADIKEGTIGVSKSNPLDDTKDNLFKFNIKNLPNQNTKAYITYELFGVQDGNAVSKSINDRSSMGGYIVKSQMGWVSQKEEINRDWLHIGENRIMFNIPQGADYQYQVKNLKLEFEVDKNNTSSILVVTNGTINYIKDNQLYIKGFLRTFNSDLKVYIEETLLNVVDGEFEGFLKLSSDLINRKFVMVKAYDATGLLGQEIISLDNIIDADKIYSIEKSFKPETTLVKARTNTFLQTEGASVKIKDNTLLENKEISISKIRNIDIAPMPSGLVNVTQDGYAYRFLSNNANFKKPVSLAIGYDEKLLPKGHDIKEIKTFFFDTQTKVWTAIKRDTINATDKTILSFINQSGDYINGIIQTPESPETAGFTPTMMDNIKAVDPSSEMTLISPPEVSQKGDANVSYPIKIPAGRNGMQPKIAIQYSNEGGNGWLGQGWNINIPSVSIDTKWGVPIFDNHNESEIYLLNGEQLMYPKVNGADWMPNRHYDVTMAGAPPGTYNTQPISRTPNLQFTQRKQGSFAKIERLGDAPSNYHWKVTNTDGTINWYGGKNDVESNAIVKNEQGDIVHWGLFMIEDVFGNSIYYHYKNNNLTYAPFTGTNLEKAVQFEIEEIFYTGINDSSFIYKIQFLDEENVNPGNTMREDIVINARTGVKMADPFRLKLIRIFDVQQTQNVIREYQLNYNYGRFSKSLLQSIAEYGKYSLDSGSRELFYEHNFEYYDDLIERKDIFSSPINVNLPSFNSDFALGYGNILNASRINASQSTEVSWDIKAFFGGELFYPTNNDYRNVVLGLQGGESYVNNTGKITMSDMDGNGLDDILYRNSSHDLCYFPHKYDPITNTHAFGPDYKKIFNINNFNKGDGTTVNFPTVDLSVFGFYLNYRKTKTKETTKIYLTDGNGDGLPDIVNNETVYFNKGLDDATNGNTFVTGSEETPNMLITAAPKVIDPLTEPDPNPDTDPTIDMNFDVVRVWEAPYSGVIKITDVVQLLPPVDNTTNCTYSIETIEPKSNNIPVRIYLREFNQNFQSENINLSSISSIYPLGIDASNITVTEGTKIYFRLHKNQGGYNNELATSPTITYINIYENCFDDINAVYSDQNGYNRGTYNYANDFILSSVTGIEVPGTGSVTIQWDPVTVNDLSDNVNFKVVKEVYNGATLTSSTILDTDYTATPNTPITISSSMLTPNYGQINSLNADDTVVFKFLVSSDSNIKWNSILWKPTVIYTPDANATNAGINGFTKYVVPEYKIYQEYGIHDFILSNCYSTQDPLLLNNPHSYYVKPNIDVSATSPQLTSSDNGSFVFVVKKNGKVIGKRKVFVSSGNISIDDNSPILFHQGIVDTQNPPKISCEYYIDELLAPNNLQTFRKFSNDVVKNVLIANDTEWNVFPTTDQIHFLRFAVEPNVNNHRHLGSMHRSWGQFMYNQAADNSNNPQDNYSKLINSAIVDNPFGGLSQGSTILGVDVSACNQQGWSNQQIYDCYQNALNTGLGIPPSNTPISQTNITSLINSILNNPNLNTSSLLSSLALVSMSAYRNYDNQQEIEKWIGLFDSQFSKRNSMRDGDMQDSTLGQAFNDPTDQDSPLLQPNQFTGMYGINRLQRSKAQSFQAGYGTSAFSYSNADYSNTDADFVDVNGDRYPDIITSNNIQLTSMTGGHNDAISGYGLNAINENSSDNFALSRRGSAPIPGRESSKKSKSDTGTPNYALGLGLNVNLGGDTHEKASFADINGDGLVDRLVQTNQGYYCILNGGTGFSSINNPVPFQYLAPNQTTPSTVGINVGISLGGLTGGLPFNVAAGFSASGGNSIISLQDINGDGLPDLISSNGSQATVRYNLGNKFSTDTETLSYGLNLYTNNTNSSASLSASFSPYVGHSLVFFIIIPFPFIFIPIWWLKWGVTVGASANLTVSEANKEFSDFNGDGYPDFIEKNGTGLMVYQSNLKRTNMLKTVINPIGGNFTIDYKVQPVDYDNPNAKWTMSDVIIYDGYNKVNDGEDIYKKHFVYEGGKYDRREREFYGYRTVKTEDYFANSGNPVIYRTTVANYHNQSYFLNGLLKDSYVMKGNNSNQKFSRTINNYEIHTLNDTNDEINLSSVEPDTYDVGGTEGRRSATVLLTRTINELYELNSSPQITSEVHFTYDNKGRVIQYDNIGDISTVDDNYTSLITYHNSLNTLNMINVPEMITVNTASGTVRERRTEVNTSNGNIIKVLLRNGNDWAETQMEYDQYGNLIHKRFPENSSSQAMYYNYTYDTTYHKYVVGITNAFSYSSSATYNSDFDKITETIDQAGNHMVYKYDNFGRNTLIIAPKEIEAGKEYTIKFEYYPYFSLLPSNSGVTANTFVPVAVTSHYDQQHPDNDIQTFTFIDGLVRPIQVKKDIFIDAHNNPHEPDFKEALSVSGKNFYDDLGRETQQFHPWWEVKEDTTKFLLNEYNSPYKSITDFDELNRPVRTTDPDGNINTMLYSLDTDINGTMAIKNKSDVDQNGSQHIITETYKNVSGNIISTKNVGGTSGSIWTKFRYDSINQLTSYTDTENITTNYKYDMLGRKILIDHPDNGTTTFKYDNVNLLSVQTANLNNQGTSIDYKYDINRLIHIQYPDDPSGNTNIANVDYKYGDTGNQTGRLIWQQDATGTQEYDYGNMGEMISNIRTVVGPNIPTRIFQTLFEYDSWNRLQNMIYPDGEKVSYSYDLGGNLNQMTGDYNDNPYQYIKRIDYDYYEQRTYLLYGNKTETFYNYTPALRRLNSLNVKTSDANDLFNNNYSYDKVGNVLGLSNSATITANNMAGHYEHRFRYDQLNRLTDAEGSFEGSGIQIENGNDANASYGLRLTYNDTHGITNKTQDHAKNGVSFVPNTYSNNYKYIQNTHKVQDIIDTNSNNVEHFKYDLNGNITVRDSDTSYRELFWDESNRLRVVADEQIGMQHYIYDASGERVLKANTDMEGVYQNGTMVNPPAWITINGYTSYPSAFIVITADGVYSKHYYAGSQRIVSRLGEQDASIFDLGCLWCKKLKESQKTDLQRYTDKLNLKINYKDYKPVSLAEQEEAIANESDSEPKPARPVPIYYYHPDHLGTSTALTDFNGNAYQFFLNLPFGETMAEQLGSYYFNSPYKFNGKELDEETGFYYYGARYYDPRVSIWMSVDPLAEKYVNRNPYEYCFSNPINLTDPTGMGPDDPPTTVFLVRKNQASQTGGYYANKVAQSSGEGQNLNIWTVVGEDGNNKNYTGDNAIIDMRKDGINIESIDYGNGSRTQVFNNAVSDFFTSNEYRTKSARETILSYCTNVLSFPIFAGLGVLYKAFTYSEEAVVATEGITEGANAAKGGYNFTKTAAAHMDEAGRMIPVQTLDDIIKAPMQVLKDPQGTNALMHYSQMWKNNKLYNVEVLYDKAANTIMHFKYTQKAIGPLQAIPK